MKARILISLSFLLCAAGSLAQEQSSGEATRELTRVKLLDEVPNYATVLVHQWSPTARLDDVEIGRSGRNFGLLIESGAAQPTTLKECIALAIENNTGLRIESLNPVSATAGVRGARAIFDPQFFGDFSKTYSTIPFNTISAFTSGGGGDFMPSGGTGAQTSDGGTGQPGVPPVRFEQDVVFNLGARKTLLTGGQLSLDWTNDRLSGNPTAVNQVVPQYVTTLGLSLNQPLLRDFGWRHALLLVDVAQITEDQAYYTYRAAIANLVSQVERSYWLLALAIQNVKVEEQGLEAARELLRQNEGRYKVGALPRTAVLEAQADVAQREAQLVRSKNLLKNARDNLRALINYRAKESEAVLMVEPSDAPTTVPYEIDLDASLRSAAERRPELLAARLDVEAKKTLRRVAENKLLPRLDFGGSIGLNGLGGDDAMVESSFARANPQVVGGYDRSLELLTDGRFYHYSVGATLEIPIANAQAKANFAQAKIDSERSWLDLHQLEENVTLEIKKAVSNLESDLESIGATRIARELAEENLRNQQARYDVGLATTKDILDFQDQVTRARREEIVALTSYNIDLAEMRRVEGTLLEARNIVVEKPDPEKAPWWARF